MISRFRVWQTQRIIARRASYDVGMREYRSPRLHDRWTCPRCGAESWITERVCTNPFRLCTEKNPIGPGAQVYTGKPDVVQS